MSEVLIKGMKMPKSCITCPLCECRNECAYCEVGDKYLSWDWDERLRSSRNDHCPLTELPPHGRLIDGDELMKSRVVCDPEEWDDTFRDGCDFALEVVRNAPTIVEEEGQ